MIYGFVQDSSFIEILDQQRARILSYAKNHTLVVDKWLDPTSFNVKKFKENDVLLLEKTFRLGKDLSSRVDSISRASFSGMSVRSFTSFISSSSLYLRLPLNEI